MNTKLRDAIEWNKGFQKVMWWVMVGTVVWMVILLLILLFRVLNGV